LGRFCLHKLDAATPGPVGNLHSVRGGCSERPTRIAQAGDHRNPLEHGQLRRRVPTANLLGKVAARGKRAEESGKWERGNSRKMNKSQR
jgi:hypothetical protein